MSITGDFHGLRQLIAKIDGAARGVVQQRIASDLAAEGERLAHVQFSEGRGPVGGPWAKRQDKPGTTLHESGNLAGSFVGRVKGSKTSASVRISTRSRYAYPLHFGWGTGAHLSRLLTAQASAGSKRAARRADRKIKRFGGLRGKAPARQMLPSSSAGRWDAPLRKSAIRSLGASFR